MKGKLTRVGQRDAHTLAGAYAMDAISAPDRERFERHLAGCEECAQEIASLREATAVLGAAVPELNCLERAGRGAAGHRRTAQGAVVEDDLDLERGVAARVENLHGVDCFDGGQEDSRRGCDDMSALEPSRAAASVPQATPHRGERPLRGKLFTGRRDNSAR